MSLGLLLLRLTLRTLHLHVLLSLLLLELLHLPSRVSVPARRFSSKPGHLGLARGIVGRRTWLALNLSGFDASRRSSLTFSFWFLTLSGNGSTRKAFAKSFLNGGDGTLPTSTGVSLSFFAIPGGRSILPRPQAECITAFLSGVRVEWIEHGPYLRQLLHISLAYDASVNWLSELIQGTTVTALGTRMLTSCVVTTLVRVK